MSGPAPALEQALALYRAPALLPAARQQALPQDLLEVIRVVAGDEQTLRQAAAASGQPADAVAEAATFYVQQVLFAPGADSYRVLGANPDAPDARIKEHYRWLVRWLHPDRNPDEWDAIYADRVNRAWQDLRQPERRAAYDQHLAENVATEAAPAAAGTVGAASAAKPFAMPPQARQRISAEQPVSPAISGRTARRLPMFVLGGLGALAGAALTLMWFAQDPPLVVEGGSPGPASVEPPAALVAASEPTPSSGPASDAIDTVRAANTDSQSVPVAAVEPVPSSRSPGVAAPAPLPPVSRAPEGPEAASAPPLATVANPPPRSVASYETEGVAARPAAVRERRPAPVPAPVAAEPVETLSAAPPAPPPPAIVTESEAQAVLASFRSAYAAGDINALMRLFTRDARNNRGGRDAIVYDYQSLFSSSESRELRLRPTGWIQRGEGATVVAKYEAKVKGTGRRLASTSRGDIRFDLRQEDGVLRIREVRHDEG